METIDVWMLSVAGDVNCSHLAANRPKMYEQLARALSDFYETAKGSFICRVKLFLNSITEAVVCCIKLSYGNCVSEGGMPAPDGNAVGGWAIKNAVFLHLISHELQKIRILYVKSIWCKVGACLFFI